jgi:uncharacterized protein YqfA (UPF0365 family)
MRGLQTKSPLTLAWQGGLAAAFITAIVTGGHWISALETGVALGVLAFLIGLGYRLFPRR